MTQPTQPNPSDRSLRPVLLLVGLVLLARVGYLVWVCRYDLVEDEAHYWLWSRYPGWSYYSKGPGVAWAIWLSTKVFGDAEWAVRLPSAIAAAVGALASGALVRDLAADAHERTGGARQGASPDRAGLAAALAYTLAPVLQGASILMTIDGPYVACWAVACWAFWRASGLGQRPAWALVGFAVGLGFLFKYTMLLLVPGLVLYAILRRRTGAGGRGVGLWFGLGVVLALAGIAPVLIWNAQHGWPTVQHLLGHLGVRGGDVPAAAEGKGWSALWLPELIATQLAMVGPWLVLAVAVAWRALRGTAPPGGNPVEDPRRPGHLLLACAAAPILVFYAIVALITEPEGNWPMAAYATLLPLAAWAAADALVMRRDARAAAQPVPRQARRRVLLWRTGLWYAAVAAIIIHKMDWIGDAAIVMNRQAWFHDAFFKTSGREPRDPAGRLRGSQEKAAHVLELLDWLYNSTNGAPFVICQHYGPASQLAYYLRRATIFRLRFEPGKVALTDTGYRPPVLCAMAYTGGRPSQFDFWAHTSLRQPGLIGRPAVIVTSTRPEQVAYWRAMFERVEPIPGGKLRGENKPDRSAFLGYGYRGPPGSIQSPAGP